MPRTLYLDTETFSPVPLQHGTHRYLAEAELLLVQWAVDDEPPQASEDFLDLPDTVDFDILVAHNSHFDRHVLRKYGIDMPLAKIRDTMVLALMHSLPGGLDKLSEIFGLPQDIAKDKRGKQLIDLFTKPRPKNAKLRRATPRTHPEEWRQFRDEYGLRDITAMRAVYKKLPKWNLTPTEIAAWHLDQKINDGGVQIDMELVEAAIQMCAEEKRNLAAGMHEMTDGAVNSATRRDLLLAYIAETFDIRMPDLKAATIERFLKNHPDPELANILHNREQAAMASVAKYKALKRSTSADGRIRNILQFCGAQRTGRWSGRVMQPQNLPRPNVPNKMIELGIEAIKGEYAELFFGNRMELAANALRGTIIAPPGRQLIVADYKNIEGRVLAWLAGEQWKLDAYRDFDNQQGPDLYTLAFCRAHGLNHTEISKDQRQLGKVMELALGYEGGVGAFVAFTMTYRVNLADLTADALPRHLWNEALDAYNWMKEQHRSTYGLPLHTWATCDTIKRAWRRAHPATVDLWRALKIAFYDALDSPGRPFEAGPRLTVTRHPKKPWILITLPSGRHLCYPMPEQSAAGSLTYMGVHQFTKQWTRIYTYGGKLAENVTQAVARDILVQGMLNAEELGYHTVLSVHDELITEVPIPVGPPWEEPHRSVEQLADLMTKIPWADGLPLDAAGFAADRYRKDD